MKAIKVGNTWLAEAGSNSMMIGKWDLEFKNKKLEKIDYKLCGVNFTKPYKENGQIVCMPYGKTYKASEEAERILQPYKEKMKELLEVLGTATENITKNDRLEEFKSSPLGNLLCDAMKEECKEYKVDIVLQNTGGLRADLQKGEITKKSIATILPFHNTIVIYKMEKSDIENILKHMVSGEVQPGGYLEVTGLKAQLENTSLKNFQFDNTVKAKTFKNKPNKKYYHIAVNSFTAGGGDGYTMFKNMKPYKEVNTTLSDALANYIKKYKKVSPNKSIRIEWKQTK
jgi:2',3'-cyclic-nucleotide 2'-phosphodiesterase (5'-nucleotidase family)